MICANIVMGIHERPIWVYISTINGTATGEWQYNYATSLVTVIFVMNC